MNFNRVKKRGQVQKHHKTWLSECRQYKIDWRNECFGVRVPGHYHATVQCLRNIDENERQWDFVGRRGIYKTLEAAIAACEHHLRVWLEAIDIAHNGRTGRTDALRTLEYRSRIRTVKQKKKVKVITHQRIMSGIPVWVRSKANIHLLNYFFPRGRKRVEEDDDECENDPTTTSSSSSTDTPSLSECSPELPTPASPVAAVEESKTDTPTATKCDPITSSAKPAEATAKAPRKRVVKSTPESLPSGNKKPPKKTKAKRTVKAASPS